MTPPRWDLFCSLVDNYGDVGVAWRLARQLAAEHGVAVRLFVDRLDALSRMTPQVDATRDKQVVQSVDVWCWRGPRHDPPAGAISAMGEVVIEAFGCGLPDAYLAGMAERRAQPLWINLEYLSAEEWIEGCHRLASRQPQLPLTRHFFFPGFTPATGGLLRERDLFAERDAFITRPEAQAALWQALGVEAPSPQELSVSLFCYPDAPIGALLDAWTVGREPVVCFVPEGVANAALDVWAGAAAAEGPSRTLRRGRLMLARVPFVAHDVYDRLLWACDLNFVRGEDSFVRAQWAARPMVWQCYPQADAAHLGKLDAFLARYGGRLPPATATAYADFARAWNQEELALAWDAFAQALPALLSHARVWAAELGAQVDLASNLAKFAAERV